MTSTRRRMLIGAALSVACNAPSTEGAQEATASAASASSSPTPPSAAPSASAEASSAPATPVAPEGMVWIAPATFEAIDGDQQKKVTAVAGFFMDRKKVTNGEYKRCFDARKCGLYYNPEDVLTPAKADWMVRNRSQREAADYCKFVGKRLPTAAEWQLAARGQEGRTYPWGNEPPAKCHPPLCAPINGGSTPEGVIGMAGVAWEYSDGVVCYTGGTRPSSREGCRNLAAVIHGGAGNTSADSYRSMEVHNDSGVPPMWSSFRCVKDAH
jgi:formylglycine-generating enzyme required for sulfatase activity